MTRAMRWGSWKSGALITLTIIVAVLYLLPVYWILATSVKEATDIFPVPPKFFPTISREAGTFTFKPTLQNYRNLFTIRIVTAQGQQVAGPSEYSKRLFNSVVIGLSSTIIATALGTLAAYAFSRFRMRGKSDLLFFILSTRMLPPVVVVLPLFLFYRALNLTDTHVGLILLYVAFNLSFAVWVMKGFMDEIPREYEEAALVDGYSRFQAFRLIVLPQAATGIAATAVFCMISAYNEFAFALMMTTNKARTAPAFIPFVVGTGGLDWGQIAAGTFLFLLPVAIFTFMLRKHLLRGVTFGAIRK